MSPEQQPRVKGLDGQSPEPDSSTKRAPKDLGDEPGWLGRVLGTGNQSRLPIAALMVFVIGAVYVVIVFIYPSEGRVDGALEIFERAFLMVLGVVVGAAATRN